MTIEITNQFPLVSIIMPLYNKRPYVKRAIESIKKQTFKNWESIVVDDGSSDSSGDEIPLEDHRIKIFRQQNSGPSVARNNGIKRASGEFLAFIDADDWYYPNKLEEEINLLREKQSPEWMVSAYDYQEGEKFVFRNFYRINGNAMEGKVIYVDDALKNLKVQGWPADGLFIKKKLFTRIGGFNKEMRYGEITEFMIRCALESPKIAVYPMPLYRVVKVYDSLSKKASIQQEGIRQFIDILYNLSKKYLNYKKEFLIIIEEAIRAYIGMLIIGGKRKQASRYLNYICPLSKKNFSIKLRLLPYVPKKLLQFYINLKPRN